MTASLPEFHEVESLGLDRLITNRRRGMKKTALTTVTNGNMPAKFDKSEDISRRLVPLAKDLDRFC